ncbi:MAG: imidazole glycerol phosphate synthase subunit HisH [Chitinophagales bacterium]|nr:imidazole glycerol phosphate synthase subunit HisH [Chitinophagales bacterium]
MQIVIIDYNAGNVQSVWYALQRLGVEAMLTNEPEVIMKADKVIFPGVGEANTTMQYLKAHKLDDLIRSLQQPVLGICLGMQLLCQYSEENNTDCLGIIPQKVVRFQPQNGEKVPHMGWNSIHQLDNSLFPQELEGSYAYFVHSYYVEEGSYTIATTDYVQPFSAALQKDNFYATQFHPEKSGKVGERILESFINL